jgi:integrase/recombinase XerD
MTGAELVPADTADDATGRLVLAWLAAQASVQTRTAYATDVAPWLLPASSHHDQPRAARTLPWLDWCLQAGTDPVTASRPLVDAYARHLESAGLAASTRARKLSSVSSWYRYLAEVGVIAVNPAEHVKRPKVDRHTSSTPGLTRDQAAELLAAADRARGDQRARNAALVALLAHTGIRISEALTADVDDLGVNRGHRTLTVTRKGGKRQAIPLAPPVTERIDAYLGERGDVTSVPALPGGAGSRPTRPLFATATGARPTVKDVYRIIHRLAELAGFPAELVAHFGSHAVRHTAITAALDAGAPLRDVQDMAGHASADTTRRYDRSRGNLDRSPVYALASYLAGGAG